MTLSDAASPGVQLIEGIAEAKRIPASPIPLRTAAVPGTGRSLIAKLFEVRVMRLYVYSDQSDQLFRSNPTVYRSEATMV
jgi:hypothetical protein